MIKTINERITEITEIYQKLNSLGINETTCKNIKKFKEIANLFVKNAINQSGQIKLPEINKRLIYILSNKTHITSSVLLKHVES